MSGEEEVRRMLAEFGRALNEHDAAAISRSWLEEGNFIDVWGRFAVGRAAVKQLFGQEFENALAEARFRALRLDLRALSEDTVVAECDSVWENVRAPTGRYYDLPHRIDAIFVRRDGAWWFMSAHPSFRRA
jgi:uncharacterized protein (TIGR02246 family)